jgi:hypothetical protein
MTRDFAQKENTLVEQLSEESTYTILPLGFSRSVGIDLVKILSLVSALMAKYCKRRAK